MKLYNRTSLTSMVVLYHCNRLCISSVIRVKNLEESRSNQCHSRNERRPRKRNALERESSMVLQICPMYLLILMALDDLDSDNGVLDRLVDFHFKISC